MKKLSIFIVAAIMSLPTLSFAFVSAPGAAVTGTKTGGIAQPLGTLSSNVTMAVLWDLSTFSATTKHLNGTKQYGSSSGSTKIYNKDLATGTAAPTTPDDSTAAFFSAWTAM